MYGSDLSRTWYQHTNKILAHTIGFKFTYFKQAVTWPQMVKVCNYVTEEPPPGFEFSQLKRVVIYHQRASCKSINICDYSFFENS